MLIKLDVPNSTKKLVVKEDDTTIFLTQEGEIIPARTIKEAAQWLQQNYPASIQK